MNIRFDILLINNNYYVFDNWIMKLDKTPYKTEKEAHNYIKQVIVLCDIMCE